ncbi:MAG: hypothetical protein HZB56_17855 [Deltaproteobacteria bacterium]|nr:hypothetical protein [Deltaproteobacteria bacterium]
MRRAARLLPLLLLAGAALASDGAAVPVELGSRGGRLWARLDLRTAFPEELRRTFANGLTNVVSLHVALLPEGGDEPAALFGRVVEVRYDVWEERWVVQVRDPQSPRGRRLVVRGWEELRGLLADARDLDLGPVAALGAGRWQLRARVELNPVSRELLERTREYIANPPSGVRGATPSRSVLGAMASYLLHGTEASEARLFHTRAFSGREVPAP